MEPTPPLGIEQPEVKQPEVKQPDDEDVPRPSSRSMAGARSPTTPEKGPSSAPETVPLPVPEAEPHEDRKAESPSRTDQGTSSPAPGNETPLSPEATSVIPIWEVLGDDFPRLHGQRFTHPPVFKFLLDRGWHIGPDSNQEEPRNTLNELVTWFSYYLPAEQRRRLKEKDFPLLVLSYVSPVSAT